VLNSFCCLSFLWVFFFFFWFLNKKLKKQHPFEMENFYNIINVFTVTFDQFSASLLNKSIITLLFFLSFLPPKFWIVVYRDFHKNIKQQKLFSKVIKQNVSWTANQHVSMIAEGSCDTEDWSNDAENSALPSHE